MFSKIKQGIQNLIQWTPLIWNDRQWDQYYLFSLLRKKLFLMEEFFENDANFVDRKKEAKKIRVCRILLDRLIKDDYMVSAFKNHEKRFGEMIWEHSPPFLLKYEKVKTMRDQIECSKSFDRCAKHEDYLRHQDLRLLFEIFRKRVLYWWD